ncbi:MAG: hypothetical protein JOZ72_09835 [Alphaproteobacteria bacterium]|nr:hypothetical protein [Alphaproteobacteria bacterium]
MLIGACLALAALSPPAFAQELKANHVHAGSVAARETLDASMARLAVKAAFQPSAQPTRQELLGVILLMSLREQRGSHT